MNPADRKRFAADPRTQGLSLRAIAQQLDVSVGTIHRDLNPETAERYRIASREHRRKAASQKGPRNG